VKIYRARLSEEVHFSSQFKEYSAIYYISVSNPRTIFTCRVPISPSNLRTFSEQSTQLEAMAPLRFFVALFLLLSATRVVGLVIPQSDIDTPLLPIIIQIQQSSEGDKNTTVVGLAIPETDINTSLSTIIVQIQQPSEGDKNTILDYCNTVIAIIVGVITVAFLWRQDRKTHTRKHCSCQEHLSLRD
jgi:hypothetical protein